MNSNTTTTDGEGQRPYGDVVTISETSRKFAAAEAIEEDDSVTVAFSNVYDGRYSDETVETGTATIVEHNPSSGGVIVLQVENDDRIVSVKSNGDVSVRDPDERRGKMVGIVQIGD